MKIIEPTISLINRTDQYNQIADCARICYNSKRKGIDDELVENERFVKTLIRNHHTSMLRHGTSYYIIPKVDSEYKSISHLLHSYAECPYMAFVRRPEGIYLSANWQYILEHPMLFDRLEPFKTNKTNFYGLPSTENLIRYTFAVTTQIGTTRELNRVSPNNIAEASTRYINFKDGIIICKPYWYDDLSKFKKFIVRCFWKCSELGYKLLYKWGLTNNGARGMLMIDEASTAVYTYTIKEWEHILMLRYYGSTGKPHPNAKIAANLIRKQLVALGYTKFVE